jgi:hypothetical protein
VSLVLAGLTNGLSQYLGVVLSGARGDETFSEYIRWGAEHPAVFQSEQAALVVSMLFLPIGLLGLAQVSRWRAPKLTAVAIVLTLLGMWGFHNVIALGYTAGAIAPGAIGVDNAVMLNDGLVKHTGSVVMALVPHLLLTFFGLILLSIACWRSRSFPRIPLVLLVAFLVWDYLLPSFGPLESHVLLFVALAWLGVHVMRMGDAAWRGAPAVPVAQPEPILSR